MAKNSSEKSGKRILLVDDDAEIVESLRLALESNGYSVLIARDGNQGLALSERENPDLVILDMMMPKRSGFLVLEKMRRTRETPLRVIMMIRTGTGRVRRSFSSTRKPLRLGIIMSRITRSGSSRSARASP